ncbi:MAG: Dephospho-CoA kinase [Candidatus Omnitrophica bacterium ADurb.Bin205]|nr:MAG: Dephospho-CoA kinase [Candidatus Omnitrophica bacterium ADurb.Bin205]
MRKQGLSKKIIIGVTGIFGSGKSTVSRIFKAHGSTIIDADKIARRYLSPETKTYKSIVNYFGRGILKAGRKIDRRKLGKVVFANRRLIYKLNSIIHPKVIGEIKSRIEKLKNGIIVLDAPLLIESGLKKVVDSLIVVIIDNDELIRRAVKKTSLKKAEIINRVKSQIPLRKKMRLADFIIDNSGTMEETRKQVKRIISKIQGGSCGETRD